MLRKSLALVIALTAALAQPLRAQETPDASQQPEAQAPDTPEPTDTAPTTAVPTMPAALPAPPVAGAAPMAEPQGQQEPMPAGGAPMPMQQEPPQAPGSAAGQWTYTSQYGWVWLPYGQRYTYVDTAGELAFSYAYYPASGWMWLASPWVLGFGPRPYWGTYGYNHFAWHARPWFHVGVYRPTVWSRWNRPYVVAHPRAFAPAPHFVQHRAFGGGHRGHR